MAQEFSRTQRVAGQIQRELAQLIQQELRDPRVGLVTISAVEVSKDMGHAKVFVTFMDPEQNVDASLKILKKAAGYLRHALGKRIVLRVTPELHFVYDHSLAEGQRVSALLDAVAAERRRGGEE
jgi:ribosome-binding factor A